MSISKVYRICNAYESGFGHGVNKDGLDGEYYADPDHNEAYQIGYMAGVERSGKPIDPIIESLSCKCDGGVTIRYGIAQCNTCGKPI